MKKFVSVIAVFLLLLTSGCVRQESVTEMDENAVPYFSYEETNIEKIQSFAAGDDGNLITAEFIDGELSIATYGEDGVRTNYVPCDYRNISDMEVIGGELYVSYSDYKDGYGFGSFIDIFSIETGEKETKAYFKNLEEIKSFCAVGNCFYAIGEDKESGDKSCSYLINDFKAVDNKNMNVYASVDGAEASLVQADFPFALASDGKKAVVYSCENENGFYFAELEEGKIGGKSYTDKLGIITAMDIEDDLCLLYSDDNHTKISACRIGETEISDIMPNVWTYDVCVKNNYCYYPESESAKIERIYIPSYYKGNTTIKMLCSGYSNQTPFGCGYNIEMSRPDDYEMALKVLSMDKDYDICYLNSRDQIAGNIRDKGSFYPLNDTKGIPEYLDQCFPYLKEAATDKNGNIWMIPVKIDAVLLYYNQKNAEQYGMNLKEPVSIYDFKSFIEKLAKENKTDSYDFGPYTYIENYLTEYLIRNSSFDTDEFRKNAVFFKEKMNYNAAVTPDIFNNIPDYVQEEVYYGNAENVIVSMGLYQIYGSQFLRCPDMSAAPAPYASDDDKTFANIVFMCVNPSSEHLNEALDYISSLAQYLLGQKNTFLFSDKSKYGDLNIISDLYDIFADAELGFAISNEIYFSDFESYLSGKITLDQFIEDADRKYSTYMNE